MRNWGIFAIAAAVALTIAGCSADEEPEPAAAPSDPLDQMLIMFNGSPSKTEIQQAMDDALNATNTPVTDDSYSRAGSVLVTFREKHGIDEMDILECIPTATTDPRIPEATFPNAAAVCVTDVITGQ